MNLLEKLKGINKKGYLLAGVVLILILGCCAAARIHYLRYYQTRPASQVSAQVFRQVELDLLYLEKLPSLRITPEQAKEILPLVEQMAAPETTAPAELARQVYGLLTPIQYEALANQTNGSYRYSDDKVRERERGYGMDNRREHGLWKDGSGVQNPREAALGSVVVKMLKDRAAEKTEVEKTIPEKTVPIQPPTPAAPGAGGSTNSQ